MKKVIYVLLAVTIVVGLVLGYAGPAASKPVTFKAVSFLPKGNPTVKAFGMLADEFNKKFKGEASINWVGGPEVIPAFQQHEAVRSGAIDMAADSCSYYVSMLPVSHGIMFSNLTHEEMREVGFFDTFAEMHKKVGLIYLGELSFGRKFYVYMNDRVKTPKDLAGKKIRVFPAISPFVKALDAAPINVTMPEIYTAMERGVVDGFVMTVIGFVKGFSWHEVTKYMIEPGFYRSSVAVLANPKKWGMLSKDLQDRIADWKYSVFDPKAEKFYIAQTKANKKMIYDSKVEVIKLSPADAKAFLELAYDSAWKGVIKKSPEDAPKLKKMLVK